MPSQTRLPILCAICKARAVAIAAGLEAPPHPACRVCGILCGPGHLEPELVGGRCGNCRLTPGQRAERIPAESGWPPVAALNRASGQKLAQEAMHGSL